MIWLLVYAVLILHILWTKNARAMFRSEMRESIFGVMPMLILAGLIGIAISVFILGGLYFIIVVTYEWAMQPDDTTGEE